MKVQSILFLFLFTLVFLSSCGVVETVFKAGMWWAFFLVALAIVLMLWIVGRAKK